MIPVILTDVPTSSDGDRSFIHEVVPISQGDDQFPDLVLLRWYGKGSQPSPIQVLSYKDGRYVDMTSQKFDGAPGSTFAARNFAVADFNGHGQGIFIADHGLDTDPFPGGQNVLLLPTADGRLTNATANLPQVLGFSHDVSTGIIDDSGHTSVFVNNIWSQAGTSPQLLISDEKGSFGDISNRLPSSLKTFIPPYTTSALVDVTGNGFMDLVLGTADEELGPSLIFPNPGNGDFSQVTPLVLPSSPLSAVRGQLGEKPKGATIQNILPIRLPDSDCLHLVVVSTRADYGAYAVQLLANDGNGNFTDETEKRFGAAITGYGGWITRVHVADLSGNGMPAIITQPSIEPDSPPSQIFLSDNAGHFEFQQTILKNQGSVCNVASINGQITLIILLRRQNPKIFRIDDTEVIGDGIPV